ncbi:MAG: STAS/SEC14 domain-containing protein [Bacteroidia bacterium]
MEKIRTKTSEMFIDEHGIFHKTVIENCHVDIETIKESDKATNELTKGKKVLMLYDARKHFTITEDAMEYARKDVFNKQRIATAIVSEKMGIKIMVDYIMNVLKSPIPIKIFTNTEEALAWLLTFKKKPARIVKAGARKGENN